MIFTKILSGLVAFVTSLVMTSGFGGQGVKETGQGVHETGHLSYETMVGQAYNGVWPGRFSLSKTARPNTKNIVGQEYLLESKRVIFLAGGSYDHCHIYFDL